ncbi:MAG: cell division protein FtsH [Candidatus Margulisiibacteriota bacterium]|nr:MAG: cell division protein FtsH [Candidatus Margulisiibacteriota bacterium]HAR64485.1 cell division protein FtsH [Candidatus Margulisiibacteriota bacterium]HCT84524.1 cell division protein FtsH [Candidatus Margulisiibacteriota bacterium]HCY37038.1 cell division protein FtsH [Candidatus Margulisiibacteriota bacterium]
MIPVNNDKKGWKSFFLYIVIFLAIISLLTPFWSENQKVKDISFSEFANDVDTGKVQSVVIDRSSLKLNGKFKDGTLFKTNIIDYPGFVSSLREKGVEIKVKSQESNMLVGFLIQLLPFIFIIGLWFFIFRQAQGANNQALSFGKSRARPWDSKVKQQITFKDIGGADEAVEELHEIVEFLKAPQKFQALGAKIPKGVLLMGAPGTGKTLLARAVAGEADVAFFSLSGSDFVEMFVGVGASRVRDLFKQAKKSQPSIIFVDEIDAVGRQRGAGLGGGHDEREQTLNQLLVEMDGFETNTSVIIMAATNRPDILDPALLRPGRFDRQIVVDRPDIKGRKDILAIHTKDKKFGPDINIDVIAQRTPGFTGADLANIVNEATLLTARKDKTEIGMSEVEDAIDRIIAGPQKKNRVMSDREKEMVAYHEVGHALVAKLLPGTDPVHKISILPRGMALGYTLQLPEADKYLVPRKDLLDQIMILLGGRVAENLQYGDITSGSSNDIKKATEIAHRIVCEYGMSDKLGPRTFGKGHEQVFLGRDIGDRTKDYGEDTANTIDEEIKIIFDTCYQKAQSLLKENKLVLEAIAKKLIEIETIERDAFINIFEELKAPLKA